MADNFEYQETMKDTLEDFFTSPSKDNFPNIIDGESEYDYLDFKEDWYEKSKLAKDILAFANSGGGAIVVGLEELDDSYNPVGLDSPRDESEFGDKVEKYIPDAAHELYVLETLKYGEIYDDEISGLTFQVLLIEGPDEQLPLVSTNGGKNIEEGGGIYVRRNTKSTIGNHEEVQKLLKKRRKSGIEKETAELHEELRQLRILYSEVSKTKPFGSHIQGLKDNLMWMSVGSEPNPNYPLRDYEEYISHLIKKKKKKIKRRLGVDKLNL